MTFTGFPWPYEPWDLQPAVRVLSVSSHDRVVSEEVQDGSNTVENEVTVPRLLVVRRVNGRFDVITRNPEALSRRQRRRQQKLLSRKEEFSGGTYWGSELPELLPARLLDWPSAEKQHLKLVCVSVFTYQRNLVWSKPEDDQFPVTIYSPSVGKWL